MSESCRPAAPIHLGLILASSLLLTACGIGSDDPTLSAPATRQASPSSGVRTLPPVEALALIAQGDSTVLDVRTPQEYGVGHLNGARNLALGDDFVTAVGALPRDGKYIVYCASGNRSGQAVKIMSGLGFRQVVDAGGLGDLAAAGADVVV